MASNLICRRDIERLLLFNFVWDVFMNVGIFVIADSAPIQLFHGKDDFKNSEQFGHSLYRVVDIRAEKVEVNQMKLRFEYS